MKTIKKQTEELLAANFGGHPSREVFDDVDKLKRIVLKLAEQVDILIQYK